MIFFKNEISLCVAHSTNTSHALKRRLLRAGVLLLSFMASPVLAATIGIDTGGANDTVLPIAVAGETGITLTAGPNNIPSIAFAGPLTSGNTIITASGNIGINTHNPSQPLEVDGNIYTTQNLIVGKANTNSTNTYMNGNAFIAGDLVLTATTSNIFASGQIVFADPNGSGNQVWIDPSADQIQLSTKASAPSTWMTAAVADIGDTFFVTQSGVSVDTWKANGNGAPTIIQGAVITNVGNATFNGKVTCVAGCYSGSDIRLKKDITPVTGALALIDKLQGVRFSWRAPDDREVGQDLTLPLDQKQIGFIAQDVQKVIPEAVLTEDHSQVLTLDVTKIVPVLVEAMKEQQKKIDELEAEINTLKAKGTTPLN